MGPVGKGKRPLRHGDIKMRPLTACLPRNQGQQDIHHRRIGSAPDISDQPEGHGWLLIRSPAQRQDPRIAHIIEIVPGSRSLRAGLSIAGDRTIDETGIDLAHGLVSQTEPVHHSGAKLLYQNIGLFKQRAQNIHCAL